MIEISLVSFGLIVLAWIIAPDGPRPERKVESIVVPNAAPARA